MRLKILALPDLFFQNTIISTQPQPNDSKHKNVTKSTIKHQSAITNHIKQHKGNKQHNYTKEQQEIPTWTNYLNQEKKTTILVA